MNAAQRRKVILERLTEADAPLSASVLAGELGVSRQIVVGDVALLRASGTQIDATPRGYQLHPAARGYTGILACVHSTADQMREELYTVVDQGGMWWMWPWRTRFTVSCAATSISPAGTTWTILSSRRRIRPSAC